MKENYTTSIHNSLRVLILLIPGLLAYVSSVGQAKPNPPQTLAAATNFKVLEEHKDPKGNIIRTIQYEQGRNRIVETLMIRPKPNIFTHLPINPDTLNRDSVMVVVNKSRYNVEVYYRRKLVRRYKAVFGPKPLENKKMEGDRCTPEGWFTIKNKNPNSKYTKFMQLNYPNDSSQALFNRLKEKGDVPKTARIGGDIGIHGIWKGGDDMIEGGVCWTDGCVAVKNNDVEELFTFVGIGTKVFIRK